MDLGWVLRKNDYAMHLKHLIHDRVWVASWLCGMTIKSINKRVKDILKHSL